MIGEWDSENKKFKGEFTFTDEEFLNSVNMILKTEVSVDGEFKPLTSMDDQFNMHGLDSLSTMMFFVWIAEFFGINETTLQELTSQKNFTIATLKDFVMKHATRTFSYEEAMEYAKQCL